MISAGDEFRSSSDEEGEWDALQRHASANPLAVCEFAGAAPKRKRAGKHPSGDAKPTSEVAGRQKQLRGAFPARALQLPWRLGDWSVVVQCSHWANIANGSVVKTSLQE